MWKLFFGAEIFFNEKSVLGEKMFGEKIFLMTFFGERHLLVKQFFLWKMVFSFKKKLF